MDEAVFVFLLFLPPLAIFLVGFCIIGCGEIRRETEERNAAEPAQRLAVERTRRWSAAEQARRSAATEQPGRLAEEAAAVEQAWRFRAAAATPAMKKELELGCFPYSAVMEGRRGRSSGQRQLECAICLEVFVHAATCSEVPWCRHLFHRDCIARWMRSKSTCPLCRVSIVPGLSEPLSAAEYMV